MATRQWIFLSNTFEVNTRTSHVKGLSIATDHDSKLHAEDSDPDILALYTPFHTVYQAYAQICGQYDAVAGIREGYTLNLETLMKEDLPEQLRLWEPVVRAVYPEDSPEEKMIFPNKRSPFLQGTYEDRISALNSLIQALTTDGNFATLVTQVESFYNTVLAARDTQQQQEGLIGQSSDLRENQRLLVMQEMQGNLGALIHKFRDDIDQVERFFDLSLLRATEGGLPATTLIVRGKVTNAETSDPVVNLPVSLSVPGEPAGITEITDANGDYEFLVEDLQAGQSGTAVVSVINPPGFQDFTQNLEVEVGNSYTLDIALQPIA